MPSISVSLADARPDRSSSAGLRDIHRLISECHLVLQADPSCLHTRAVRGHACMKAKLWDQAVRDFSEILHCRPDDVHGRFSRGMALFKSGHVDDAHRDFSRVLELNPNHVMARYARAGCYNSEGEFNQAIQEYTLALQHDEKENAGGFRAEKRRIGMHESAEHLIRKTMGASARLRSASQPEKPCETKPFASVLESLVDHPTEPVILPQELCPRAASVPGKRPRKVVQVRVSLSGFALAAAEGSSDAHVPPAPLQSSQVNVAHSTASLAHSEGPKSTCGNTPNQQTRAARGLAVRAVPKTVRRVTVAL
ncbi:hypothetical protein PRIC2_011753 [Phytophthora ramorum]